MAFGAQNTLMHRCRNDNSKFNQKLKRLTEAYRSGASSCKDENGNLVTDPQGVLRLWRKHFSTLLQDDDDTNAAFRDVVQNLIDDDDGMEIPPPSHEEVKVAITRLKNNKAASRDGFPAELFKTGCNELVGRYRQLIYKIWLEESMSNNWNLSVLCPVLKKGEPTTGVKAFNLSHIRFLHAYCVND